MVSFTTASTQVTALPSPATPTSVGSRSFKKPHNPETLLALAAAVLAKVAPVFWLLLEYTPIFASESNPASVTVMTEPAFASL